MGIHIWDNKLIIITEPKTIHFNLPKVISNNLKYEIDFIIRDNELLTEHKIKNKISRLLFKHKHVSDIHEHGK